jgi:hypothetical protein
LRSVFSLSQIASVLGRTLAEAFPAAVAREGKRRSCRPERVTRCSPALASRPPADARRRSQPRRGTRSRVAVPSIPRQIRVGEDDRVERRVGARPWRPRPRRETGMWRRRGVQHRVPAAAMWRGRGVQPSAPCDGDVARLWRTVVEKFNM